MNRDMELSCDEKVLNEMKKDIKKPYASLLLNLAAEKHFLNVNPIAFGEGNVKERIKNVLSYKKPGFWIIFGSALIAVTVGAGLLTNPKSVVVFAGSAYRVNDILYQSPFYSFSYRLDTAPGFIISSDYNLYRKDDADEGWNMLGKLYEYEIGKRELYELFQLSSESIYDEIKKVKLVYRTDIDDDVKTFYLVMQQQNGDTLLAIGYDNDISRHIRWLFSLEKLNNINDDAKGKKDISESGNGQSDGETVSPGLSQSDDSSDEQDSYDEDSLLPYFEAASKSSDVENLPKELYLSRNFDSANVSLFMYPRIYTFDVKEETTFTIKSEINIGSLSIKLQDHDSNEVVYETEELIINEDSVTLQPGTYRLILKGKLSNGYVHITSQ